MKVILYCLNFKPEIVATGKYNGELADYLFKKGNNIRVITAPKYYPEWKSDKNKYFKDRDSPYKIYRCPLYIPKLPNGIKRIWHLISFSITSLPILLLQLTWEPNLIILVVPTLFCAPNILLFKLLSSKKVTTILHIQDFELEAAFNLGILKGKQIKYFFSKVENWIYKKFDYISTISNGMLKRLTSKGLIKNTMLFTNWVDINLIKPKDLEDKKTNKYRNKLQISSETVIIQYSGTMNKKQGFSFLLPIIKSYNNREDILWLFGGEGPTKNEIIKSTKNLSNIIFLPLQRNEDMNDWLNAGDIHIIPQDEEVEDLVFPSKLLAILASGRPIVSNTSSESELGRFIEDAGIRVDPRDKDGFINALNTLINDPNIRKYYGVKAREIATKTFCKEKVLEDFESFINNILKNEVT
tara:strand:+ start:257 stop:1492 length:1236 start_codon:yes stop_codon:yes gene_type:complete